MKKICYLLVLCCFWISANASIKIGAPLYDPPYVQLYDPINGLEGFDIDYMKKICIRLNWDCQFVPMKYDELFPALRANEIDFAIGSLVITPDKQENFLFSLPYLMSDIGFIVKKNTSINTVSDLQGKTVGALSGKAYLDYLQEKFPYKINISTYNVFRTLALDLYDGKIDAVGMNYLSALYIQHQHPNVIKVLGEHFNVGSGMGIATIPSNKDKMDQINKVILQFESDGTFATLYNYTFQFIIPPSTKSK